MIVVFTADFSVLDIPNGGAEQDDAAMLSYLPVPSVFVQASQLSTINPANVYIVGNFFSMPTATRQQLIQYGNYIIYEHDYHFVNNRNPMSFPDWKVPEDQLINVEFYQRARAVICMTNYHKSIFERSIQPNVKVLGGSFWSKEDLALLESLANNPDRLDKAFIHGVNAPLKGSLEAVKFCADYHIPYDVVPSLPTRKKFLETLANYSKFVFLPRTPETCSRVTCEARMLGLQTIVTENIGAIHEPWFVHTGLDLIKYVREEMIPKGVELIKGLI